MLCALNRSNELAVHVRGAVNNGASEVEIRETLLQAAIYCGMRMFKFPILFFFGTLSRKLSSPYVLLY